MPLNTVTSKGTAAKTQTYISPEQVQAHNWKELMQSISSGRYCDSYKIGDMLPITIGRFGQMHARIIAMDMDELSGNSGKKAALTFMLSNCLPEPKQMNQGIAKEDPNDRTLFVPGTGAVDGWGACAMRKYLNEKVFPEFPQFIRENIVPVAKVSRTFTASSQIFDVVTDDKLWLLSKREVFGPGRFTEMAGPVYDEFFKRNDDRIIMDSDGNAWWWWLRSASNDTVFSRVGSDGSNGNSSAYYEGGVAFGFCIETRV